MRSQFTLRQVLLVILVYACLFGLIAALRVPAIQAAAAIIIVTLFVVADLTSSRKESNAIPAWPRAVFFVARYATAFAISTAVCFAIESLTHEPAPPPSPLSAFESLGLVFGFLPRRFIEPMFQAIVIVVAYAELFVIFSTIGLVASIVVIRRFRSARWLALANLPGAVLLCWVVVESLAKLNRPKAPDAKVHIYPAARSGRSGIID